MAIQRLAIALGAVVFGLSVAPSARAQNTDTFREATPPAPTLNPRPRPGPVPEQEPQTSPAPFPYDGIWVGFHRCPEFNNRQAFQHELIMQIKNGRASAVTSVSAGSPGYITFDGAVEPGGRLVVHGYAISRGQPGAAPVGTRFAFDYDGTIAAGTYTARDLGSRPCTIELARQR